MATLLAGSGVANITPDRSLHLFGYPHVPRFSTGIHDPLLSSALYLEHEGERMLFVANDIIFVPKNLVKRARRRIHQATGVPPENILVSATHTHSGPDTVRYASNEADETVAPPDAVYLQQLENGIVAAACAACEAVRPATLSHAVADGSCVGTNRRDPAGPSHPETPVLIARDAENDAPLAVILLCSMHPTVLHEDSTLISGDFPGLARQWLQDNVVGADCPVLHHTGACGNLSPRHVITETTFDEAKRLGAALGAAVAKAMGKSKTIDSITLACARREVFLPLRTFPPESEARKALEAARERFSHLSLEKGLCPETRTAECDVFGAEEVLTLARLAGEEQLHAYADTCLPAEVQGIAVGHWRYLAFPGELFVEYALELEAEFPNTHVMTLANGELQGYIVTEEAIQEGGYEASNALFKSPESGDSLMVAAREVLDDLDTA